MGFAHSKFYAQRSTSVHNDEVPENCLRQESMCFNLACLKNVRLEPYRKKSFKVLNMTFWLFLEFTETV